MAPKIIPIDQASRLRGTVMVEKETVVDRLCAELEKVMELRRRTEQELQSIRERAFAQDRLAALGQLAACAVHEMNQPLFFLKLFSESIIKNAGAKLIAPHGLCDEAKEANRQIDRIHKISQQILRYSRPEPEPLALQEVRPALERALVLMNPQLRRFGVKLSETTRDAVLLPILGSAGLLEQLFVNLLRNAIDAVANQGEKKIHIRFKQQKRHLLITVHDNGPGVPELIRDQIFEPFFTTKHCGQGTGLGLAIVADIVRAHQGEIRLNTKKKTGAEFIIKFPVRRGQQDLLPAPSSSTSDTATT